MNKDSSLNGLQIERLVRDIAGEIASEQAKLLVAKHSSVGADSMSSPAVRAMLINDLNFSPEVVDHHLQRALLAPREQLALLTSLGVMLSSGQISRFIASEVVGVIASYFPNAVTVVSDADSYGCRVKLKLPRQGMFDFSDRRLVSCFVEQGAGCFKIRFTILADEVTAAMIQRVKSEIEEKLYAVGIDPSWEVRSDAPGNTSLLVAASRTVKAD